MRIARGILKGRHIPNKYPSNTRPVESKIKDAVFDIIGNVYMARCLDLFAGTGAFGLEALSRGAREVIFNDIHGYKLNYIETLLKRWNFPIKNYKFIKMDAIKLIKALHKKRERFDIIFIDPPFSKEIKGINIAQLSLNTISDYPIVSENGIFIIRTYKKDILSLPKNIKKIKEKIYGINRVYILSIL
jgi:16S rRNA (guanine(966)-N(2))-methyltransferase RsmD